MTSLLIGCSSGGSSGTSTTTGTSTSTSTTTTTGMGGAGGSTTTTTGAGGSGGSGGSTTTTTGAGGSGGSGGSTTTGAGGAGGAGGSIGTGGSGGMGGAATTTTTTAGAGGMGGAATTTTTTTGAGGAPPFCVPGSTQPCYSGPMGTEGVGPCKAGIATCDAMGSAFGACMGEVLPALDNCASAADEDCSAATGPCVGTGLWSKVMGANFDDEGASVGLDPQGNVLLGAYSTGMVDFGCGVINAGPNNSALLVKYAPGGGCLWSKTFGNLGAGNNVSEVKSVASDAAGNVYLLGYLIGSADFGGGVLTSASVGESDVLIAKYSPAGAHLWSKRFGAAGNQYARSIAVDSQGNAVITGFFFGSIDFGGGVLASAGATDVYVAKFSPAGALLWAKRYGNVSGQESYGVAVDAADNIVVTGTLKGTMDFGGGNLTSAGLGDVFVAKLDPAGNHLWSKHFGDAADQTSAAVAVDPAGNVIVVGGFSGTINFGGGNIVSAGGIDAFLVKLSPNGDYMMARVGAGTNNQTLSGVSADAFGNLSATGYISDSADFGGGNLMAAAGQDVVVVRYDPAGNHLWSKRFGAAGTEVGRSVVNGKKGELYVTGLVNTATDFGMGPQIGGGGEDIFIAGLAP
ncbi:MAG: SBBP repeat-containing protein [Byssovorax sp.]